MLVLTRTEGESVEVPDIDLSIRLLKISGGKIRLGIEAPRFVRVIRGELRAASDAKQRDADDPSLRSDAQRLEALLDRVYTSLNVAEERLASGQHDLAEAAIEHALTQLADYAPYPRTALLSGATGEHVSEATGDYLMDESTPPIRDILRVVLVGDALNSADVLGELIASDDIDVRLADDGAEAEEMLAEAEVDVVVLDPNMMDAVADAVIERLQSFRAGQPLVICRVERLIAESPLAALVGDDEAE